MSRWLVVLVAAAGIAGIYAVTSDRRLESPAPRPTPSGEAVAARLPFEGVTLDRMKWTAPAGGAVAEMSFELFNANAYDVKDVPVVCRFYGNSGTEVSAATRTIFETVPRKGRKRVARLNFGFIDPQASSAVCDVTTARR